MPRVAAVAIGLVLLAAPTTASALCSYAGVLYLRPTLQREFADADLVVRVRVETEILSERLPGAGDGDLPWVAHRLIVVDDFKDTVPTRLTYFTTRDSGAFYLGDPGEEFLLFLNPARSGEPGAPHWAREAFSSNYCGNSKRWSEITADEHRSLTILSGRPAGPA